MSFTERTKAPFRLDVVGSFLRPDAIKEARAAMTIVSLVFAPLFGNGIIG